MGGSRACARLVRIVGSIAGIFLAIFIIRVLSGSIKLPKITLVWAAKIGLFFITIPLLQVATPNAALSFVLLAIACVLIWTPTVILRSIVLPLRMPRLAYWTVRLCWPLGFAKENVAGGVIFGALALARKGAPDEAVKWLEQKLARAQPIQGAGVVAAGLLAALRQEGDPARSLLLLADGMNPRLISRAARAIARDWLVVDAALVGNWQMVIRLGRRGTGRLRWSYSMARIAERLTGDPKAWGALRLWLCFLLAPRRRATFPIFRRALAVPLRRSAQPQPPASVADLPAALGALARAIGEGGHDGEALARSVEAVNGQLDTMRDKVEQRFGALGGRGDAVAVLSDFRHDLIDLLMPLIEDNPCLARAAQQGSLMEQAALEQAVSQVRRRLFGDIESRCKDYRERTTQEEALDLLPEWQAWATLQCSVDQLMELDPAAESVLFQTVFAPVCNFAVFQHNGRKRIALAHDMFVRLLRRSGSDPQACTLLAKNVQAGVAGV
jgi:hypothetical protein